MQQYLNLVRNILDHGKRRANRTGIDQLTITGAMLEHDMSQGFPLLTTKKVPFRLVASELEFFIKGMTDKHWLKEKYNNHIWDEWATRLKVPYGHDEETKQKMAAERDLGPIYGFQWRHFNAPYRNHNDNYDGEGVDQLKNLVATLKSNPTNRRMVVSAWNPSQNPDMALPPCHYGFQVTVLDNKLNLLWNQRSVDTMLGLPFNIASYALLLHLLAKETGYEEGKLVGFLADVHIYVNHIEGAQEQLQRDPDKYPLPCLETDPFASIFAWHHKDTKLKGYESYPKISFDIAV